MLKGLMVLLFFFFAFSVPEKEASLNMKFMI